MRVRELSQPRYTVSFLGKLRFLASKSQPIACHSSLQHPHELTAPGQWDVSSGSLPAVDFPPSWRSRFFPLRNFGSWLVSKNPARTAEAIGAVAAAGATSHSLAGSRTREKRSESPRGHGTAEALRELCLA